MLKNLKNGKSYIKPLNFDIFRSNTQNLATVFISIHYEPSPSTIWRIFVELRTKYCKQDNSDIFRRHKRTARLLVQSSVWEIWQKKFQQIWKFKSGHTRVESISLKRATVVAHGNEKRDFPIFISPIWNGFLRKSQALSYRDFSKTWLQSFSQIGITYLEQSKCRMAWGSKKRWDSFTY